MKKKKGQIVGEIFIFILAVAIFTLILVYGYRAIISFTTRGETVALLELQQQIERQVNVMSLDYGSTDKMEVKLPSEFTQICFVGYSQLDFANAIQLDKSNNQYKGIPPLIIDALEGGTKQNVFLIPFSDTPLQVGNISVNAPSSSPGILCLNATRGTATVLLEGLGASTRISHWS